MKKAKKYIHTEIYNCVKNNSGVTPAEVVEHVIKKLANNNSVSTHLTRERVSGCISPHVCIWHDMTLKGGRLYTR